ncbi:MAG: aminotransferase class V-fold PLP-dependent enzyme [Nanobdellota archaeon]
MRWPILTREDIKGVLDLLSTRSISIKDGSGIIGQFEEQVSAYLQTPYTLVQNSGTSTLHAAYFAIGLTTDDEVLVPSYTWHATASPLFHVNAIPVFCEVTEDYCIDPDDILKRITEKTRAITVVHAWGHPCDMDRILAIAREHKLWVIEDCSHAFGTEYKNRKVGSIGDVACFSMQKNKPLSCGEGGILTTRHRSVYERAIFLGHPGRLEETQYHSYGSGLGFKYRPHPLVVSLAATQLRKFDRVNAYKNKNSDYLTKKLKEIPFVKGMDSAPYCTARSYYSYRLQNRTDNIDTKTLLMELKKQGVPVKEDPYLPLHQQPLFQGDKCRCDCLPTTEKLHAQTLELKLPVKPDLQRMSSLAQTIRKTVEDLSRQSILEKKFNSKPLHIEYEATMRCNLQCSMCYQKEYRNTYSEIPAEEFLRCIDGIRTVSITGGECLLKDDIIELIEGLAGKGIEIRLLTNGFTSQEMIDRLKEYPFQQIRTSLDGLETVHDRIRQPGSFKRTMHFIEELKTNDIRISAVDMDQPLTDLVEELKSKGIKTTIIPDEAYTESEIKETKDRLRAILEEPRLMVRTGENKEKGNHGVCKNLVYPTMRIDPEGNAIGCRMIRNTFGNIREQSIESIWNSPAYRQFMTTLIEGDLPICKRCPKRMKQ